jgi:hypothetical protein
MKPEQNSKTKHWGGLITGSERMGVRSLSTTFRSKTRKTENEDRKWELTWLRENGGQISAEPGK